MSAEVAVAAADRSVGRCVSLRQIFASLRARGARVCVGGKVGPSRGLVEHDSVECCFQPALSTCPEEQRKLTRIMPQHTPRTTRRRSSEQTPTVCTYGNQMVWRPMLGILARVGQNAFRGGIVNHWYHSEMSTSGGVCLLEASAAPCIPRAVLAAEWRHSFAHQQDAQVRLLESEAIYGRVRTTVARWVWGL